MGDFSKDLPDIDTLRSLDVKQLKYLQEKLQEEKYRREVRLRETQTLLEKVVAEIQSKGGTPLPEFDNS